MTTRHTTEAALLLNEQEQETLLFVLEQALEESRVRKRRTEAFHAREQVQSNQNVLQGLADKLRRLHG